MTTSELVRALGAAGFVLAKRGSKHDIYVHPASGVTFGASHGRNNNPRVEGALRAAIRRARRRAE